MAPNFSTLLLICLTLGALQLGGCAAESGEKPGHELLERRKQARQLQAIAERAMESQDGAKAFAAYELLIDLWADMPEAKRGGIWAKARIEAKELADYQSKVSTTQTRGLALKGQLESSDRTLRYMRDELERVVESEPPDLSITQLIDISRGLREGAFGGHVGAPRGPMEQP